jgi:type II secretory pathway component GspD/PulD (secretin)
MQDVGRVEHRLYDRSMGSLRVLLCVIAAAGLIATTGLPADDRVVKVYPLGLTDPAAAAELVRGMLSPDGRVVDDVPNHRLIVLDRPVVQARVAEALKSLRIPARNVRITVSHSSERVDDASQIGVSVGGRSHPPVDLTGGASSSRSTAETRQDIVVLSGGRARIQVAEQVPYADWFWTWGQGSGLWPAQSVQWRDVGTSLAVEPFVLDDHTIRLRVTPEFSYFLDRDRFVSRVQQLSTEVIVREGEEIDLGGLPMSNREFKERFLIGTGRSGQAERMQIRLKARVQP